MKKIFNLVAIVGLVISGTAYAKPQNSHSIEEFEKILSGKVFVGKTPLWEISNEAKKLPFVSYLASDGTEFQCSARPVSKNSTTLKYKTFQGHPKWNKWRLTKQFFGSGILLTTNGNDTRSIPVYDEKNNILERWYKRKKGWRRLVVGHLQDTWPAWALEKCPDLVLPKGLKINHDQNTTNYDENYKAVMGKPFPELSQNKPQGLTTPLKADGTEVSSNDVVDDILEDL
ncbi:hypothetical protein [Kiloniella sp.]|uniref:hypothetical protein n=1 Tax=Kiloniella sp. TaxID=1938587 RepID=UPI003B012D1F